MRIRLLSTLVLLSLVFACKQNPQSALPTLAETTEGETIYLGTITKENLNNNTYTPWFEPAYENFQVPEEWIKQHKPLAKKLEFIILMGTWCSDSQREVPGMIRLIEALDRDDQLKIYALDEFKQSEGGIEKTWNVEQVPTLIVLDKGEELNRIDEFPLDTLEADLGCILRKEPYKHAYALD